MSTILENPNRVLRLFQDDINWVAYYVHYSTLPLFKTKYDGFEVIFYKSSLMGCRLKVLPKSYDNKPYKEWEPHELQVENGLSFLDEQYSTLVQMLHRKLCSMEISI